MIELNKKELAYLKMTLEAKKDLDMQTQRINDDIVEKIIRAYYN